MKIWKKSISARLKQQLQRLKQKWVEYVNYDRWITDFLLNKKYIGKVIEKKSGTRLYRLHGGNFGFYSNCNEQPLDIYVVGSDSTLKEIIVVAV